MRNGSLWSNIVFEKEVISHTKINNNLLQLKPFVMHPKADTVILHLFFLSLFSCKFDDNWAQILTGLLFYTYVGSHMVIILVFDSYKTCSVPLIALWIAKKTSLLFWITNLLNIISKTCAERPAKVNTQWTQLIHFLPDSAGRDLGSNSINSSHRSRATTVTGLARENWSFLSSATNGSSGINGKLNLKALVQRWFCV